MDFPASSFFDVFVKVDLPACGSYGFPGSTLYNEMPLVVKNNNLTQFPPKVAYLHDPSILIPIYFWIAGAATPPPPAPPVSWKKGDILGYFLLAGHGVGFSNSSDDTNAFNSTMSGQPDAQCPLTCPAPQPAPSPGTASKTTGAAARPIANTARRR